MLVADDSCRLGRFLTTTEKSHSGQAREVEQARQQPPGRAPLAIHESGARKYQSQRSFFALQQQPETQPRSNLSSHGSLCCSFLIEVQGPSRHRAHREARLHRSCSRTRQPRWGLSQRHSAGPHTAPCIHAAGVLLPSVHTHNAMPLLLSQAFYGPLLQAEAHEGAEGLLRHLFSGTPNGEALMAQMLAGLKSGGLATGAQWARMLRVPVPTASGGSKGPSAQAASALRSSSPEHDLTCSQQLSSDAAGEGSAPARAGSQPQLLCRSSACAPVSGVSSDSTDQGPHSKQASGEAFPAPWVASAASVRMSAAGGSSTAGRSERTSAQQPSVEGPTHRLLARLDLQRNTAAAAGVEDSPGSGVAGRCHSMAGLFTRSTGDGPRAANKPAGQLPATGALHRSVSSECFRRPNSMSNTAKPPNKLSSEEVSWHSH